MNLILVMMTLLGVAAGLLAGVLFTTWSVRRQASASFRVPTKWPLLARCLVTPREEEVWTWLRRTFHDHLVMIKVPVLRFTIPMDGERHKRAQWLEMLNGVYTTFTVCTPDGDVVGCVDVPGRLGLSQASRALKEALLSDCNISYTVVHSASLPRVDAMRAAFLGEIANDFTTEPLPMVSNEHSFDAEVKAFTAAEREIAKESAQRQINRDAKETSPAEKPPNAGVDPAGAATGSSSDKPERFPVRWENSFIDEPSDTRPARLK